jgi:hypothetical protein
MSIFHKQYTSLYLNKGSTKPYAHNLLDEMPAITNSTPHGGACIAAHGPCWPAYSYRRFRGAGGLAD